MNFKNLVIFFLTTSLFIYADEELKPISIIQSQLQEGLVAYKNYDLEKAHILIQDSLKNFDKHDSKSKTMYFDLYFDLTYTGMIIEIRKKFTQGDYKESLQLVKSSINFLEASLENSIISKRKASSGLIDMEAMLANINIRTGYFDTAIDQLISIKKKEENLYGQKSIAVSRTFLNIGASYFYKGDYINALKYCEKALEISSLPKIDNPLGALNCISNIYLIEGKPEVAKVYFDKQKIKTNNSETKHRQILTKMSLLNTLGLSEEAIIEGNLAVKLIQKESPEHPDLISAINLLGTSYFSAGYVEKAKSLFLDALTLERNMNSLDQTKLISTLLNILNTGLSNQESKSILKEITELIDINSKSGSFEIIRIRNIVAKNMEKNGEILEAKKMLEENLKIIKTNNNKNSLNYLSANIQLNIFLYRNEMISDYELISFLETLSISDNFKNLSNYVRVNLMDDMVWSIHKAHPLDGKKMMNEIVIMKTSLLGEDHPNVAEARLTYLVMRTTDLFENNQLKDELFSKELNALIQESLELIKITKQLTNNSIVWQMWIL